MNKRIDIEEVIRSKNPRLLHILPKFIISYLKKIIHEEHLNAFLEQHGHLTDFEFIDASLKYLNISHKVINEANIPEHGRFIMASNHPLGGPDGLILMNILGNYRSDIRFIVNDILSNLGNIKKLFLPVNKHGSNPKEAIKLINEFYASDFLILNFPFGLVSRKRRGRIQDLVWHKSFISKAKQYKRDIIPIYFDGRNSNFFYNLSNIRRFLRIRANIEMLYLVHEMYKQSNKTFEITIGKPIPYTTFSKEYSDEQWAEHMRKHVYKLKNNPNIEFTF